MSFNGQMVCSQMLFCLHYPFISQQEAFVHNGTYQKSYTFLYLKSIYVYYFIYVYFNYYIEQGLLQSSWKNLTFFILPLNTVQTILAKLKHLILYINICAKLLGNNLSNFFLHFSHFLKGLFKKKLIFLLDFAQSGDARDVQVSCKIFPLYDAFFSIYIFPVPTTLTAR